MVDTSKQRFNLLIVSAHKSPQSHRTKKTIFLYYLRINDKIVTRAHTSLLFISFFFVFWKCCYVFMITKKLSARTGFFKHLCGRSTFKLACGQ